MAVPPYDLGPFVRITNVHFDIEFITVEVETQDHSDDFGSNPNIGFHDGWDGTAPFGNFVTGSAGPGLITKTIAVPKSDRIQMGTGLLPHGPNPIYMIAFAGDVRAIVAGMQVYRSEFDPTLMTGQPLTMYDEVYDSGHNVTQYTIGFGTAWFNGEEHSMRVAL